MEAIVKYETPVGDFYIDEDLGCWQGSNQISKGAHDSLEEAKKYLSDIYYGELQLAISKTEEKLQTLKIAENHQEFEDHRFKMKIPED